MSVPSWNLRRKTSVIYKQAAVLLQGTDTQCKSVKDYRENGLFYVGLESVIVFIENRIVLVEKVSLEVRVEE